MKAVWSRIIVIGTIVGLLCYATIIHSLPASSAFAEPLPSVNPKEAGFSADGLAKLASALEKDIEEKKFPGAVVLIARKGKIAYFEAFGVNYSGSDARLGKNWIFRIYSMTKPITSVAAMQLYEQGKLKLTDLVSKYIPSFKGLKVQQEGGGLVAPQREMIIKDLLIHTSGLTYGFFGSSEVRRLYVKAGVLNPEQTLAELVSKLSQLPLEHHPGTVWEYSRSTDVLGYIVEVLSGTTLDQYFDKHILGPLRMTDTSFFVPEEKEIRSVTMVAKPQLLSGGGGLVSTAGDYARFCQMLLNGGTLDGARILKQETVKLMTTDHLGSIKRGLWDGPGPGYGFGYGFAIRRKEGSHVYPGTAGDFWWGGYAGTYYWIDPKRELITVYMMNQVSQRARMRPIMRRLVYSALGD